MPTIKITYDAIGRKIYRCKFPSSDWFPVSGWWAEILLRLKMAKRHK